MTESDYRYGGAKALVALHARHLRAFLATWRRADARALELPATSDPAYASHEALLAHVLGAAARYLDWMCEHLALPRPELETRPEAQGFAARADQYLETVLAAWEVPLRSVTEEVADTQAFPSRWGPPYTIDAMLEHAVMHPIRHGYQLENAMEKSR